MKILENNNFKSWKIAKNLSSQKIIKNITDSGLFGHGGAHYPVGLKWKNSYPAKYLIINGDESEPGFFKDRFILDNNPELLIEGINIAMHALKAELCIIYLREEYRYQKNNLENLLKKYCHYKTQIIIGAGSYICGDETSILNSIEGLRPETRQKPPFPSEFGLYGQKTCINNIETIARVPLVFLDDFDPKLMLVSVSGDVELPGVYEVQEGIKQSELLELVKAISPKAMFFGASGGCVPIDKKIILENSYIRNMGAMFQTGIIILNDKTNIPDFLRSIIQFFNEENCGKCTPCREGNFRLLQIFQVILKRKWTKEEFAWIKNLTEFIPYGSQCALGKSSTIAIKTSMKYFEKEYKQLTK